MHTAHGAYAHTYICKYKNEVLIRLQVSDKYNGCGQIAHSKEWVMKNTGGIDMKKVVMQSGWSHKRFKLNSGRLHPIRVDESAIKENLDPGGV